MVKLDSALARAMNRTRTRTIRKCRYAECGKPFAALVGQDYHSGACRRQDWYRTHYQPTGNPRGRPRKNTVDTPPQLA